VTQPASSSSSRGIAIIGMAGRFPNASSLDQFWLRLREGTECITRFTDEELAAEGVPLELRRHERYVPARGVIDGRELFDASFFGISPREAELTDPQQRLLLECAWEAFENAGYDPERPSGSVGVFAGVGMNSYLIQRILGAPDMDHSAAAYQAFIGNDKDFCATRLSYKLGLRGPSVNVQTACSTSLVAVHLAAQALMTYQCDMALAGAASVEASRSHGYLYEEGMILSPDGHCRAFDQAAGGTVGGEGVAVVLLKRLADALTDRDPIRAVILGTAINNDGSLKAGFTAPSVEGQHEVIVLAQSLSGVEPDTIGYVEGHGTATPLGDPIEVAALTRAFRERTTRRGFCALGSVKSNIGHTDTVAGLAGLTKTVLALEHAEIPPTVHFTSPNVALDLDESPFFINTEPIAWPDGMPRRAAVSSFGIGGTNAHAVLEQAPPREARVSSGRRQILTLSARSTSALDVMSQALAAHLAARPDLDLADVAFTLQEGRRPFDTRRTVLCRSRDEAIALLKAPDPRQVHDFRTGGRVPAVAFMFSGQGSQYPGMAADLYASEPLFRETVDRCCAILAPFVDRDLRELLFPADPTDPEIVSSMTMTMWAQPALFTIDYALAQLWIARGIEPDAMIGHSLGEYVAAAVADVLSLDHALRLVAARGRLMQSMAKGAMTAVPLSEHECRAWLPADVSLAAINAAALVVASGPTPAIEALEATLLANGVQCRRLHTSHAFHSSMMEPMLEPFRAELSRLHLEPPRRRYVSNLTGQWITPEQATSPDYWIEHLRQPVRFSQGLGTLAEEPARVLIEVGPGRALASIARTQGGSRTEIVTSLRHVEESLSDDDTMSAATAHLWRLGATIDWRVVHALDPRDRVVLPTYPFERQRFWIDTKAPEVKAAAVHFSQPAKRADVSTWFHVPSWTRSAPAIVRRGEAENRRKVCLLFREDEAIAAALAQTLQRRGYRVIDVQPGRQFDQHGPDAYAVRPGAFDDCSALFARLRDAQVEVDAVVHLWGIGASPSIGVDVEETCRRTYDSVIGIAQGLGAGSASGRRRIVAVTTGLHDVVAGDVVSPEKALIVGPCRVVSMEYPQIVCTSVDIDPASASTDGSLVEALASELERDDEDVVVAYRHGRRWVQRFETMALQAPPEDELPLRDGGVYLFTGGFGAMALVLADAVAASVKARLVLVGRSPIPPQAEWDAYLAAHDDADRTGRAIRYIRALEAKGAEVMVAQADVIDREAMRHVVDDVRQRFGRIDGVVHTAGIAGGGLLGDPAGAAEHRAFAAKVSGTPVLFEVMSEEPPAWIALCSSLNAVFPSVGATDYCAASAYLDAFADAHDDPSGTRVISIGWDTWQEAGMAVDLSVPRYLEDAKRENLRHGMTNAEGQEVFRRALSCATPRLLVLTQGYDSLRGMRSAMIADGREASSGSASHTTIEQLVVPASTHARPAGSSDYVAPDGEVEEEISHMWEGLLGIRPIGRHDNFFELGGHSLLATQLISRIRDRFGVQLPLRTIFDASTIADLALHVSSVKWALGTPVLAGQAAREEIDL
jgi:acyl transferase domain-containing protein/acyl carrier protein